MDFSLTVNTWILTTKTHWVSNTGIPDNECRSIIPGKMQNWPRDSQIHYQTHHCEGTMGESYRKDWKDSIKSMASIPWARLWPILRCSSEDVFRFSFLTPQWFLDVYNFYNIYIICVYYNIYISHQIPNSWPTIYLEKPTVFLAG